MRCGEAEGWGISLLGERGWEWWWWWWFDIVLCHSVVRSFVPYWSLWFTSHPYTYVMPCHGMSVMPWHAMSCCNYSMALSVMLSIYLCQRHKFIHIINTPYIYIYKYIYIYIYIYTFSLSLSPSLSLSIYIYTYIYDRMRYEFWT